MPQAAVRRASTPSARWPARVFAAALLVAASAAWAAAASDRIVVSEFLPACGGPPNAGAFVEFRALVEGQTLDPDIGLRTLDGFGYVLGDVPGVFAAHAGEPLAAGQRYLVAGSGFASVTGLTPDGVIEWPTWPAIGERGALQIYRRDAGGSLTVLSELRFAASFDSIDTYLFPGRSLYRIADGQYAFTGEPSPTNRAGNVARVPGCASASTDRRLAVTSFALACADGGSSAGMVVVSTSFLGGTPDPDLRLRIRDRNGVLLFEQAVFDSALVPRYQFGSVLFGSPDFRTPDGSGPDHVLPVPLDPEAGQLSVLGLDAFGADVLLDDVHYGHRSGDVGPPLPGSMLIRDFEYTPTPFRPISPIWAIDRKSRPHAVSGCPQGSQMRIQSILGECTSSGVDGRYVQVGSNAPGEFPDTSLFLEMFDATGAPLGRQSLAIPEPPPMLGNGRAWLLGGPAITSSFGDRADVAIHLPVPADGSLLLGRADPFSPGEVEELHRVSWGNGGLWPRLEPGRELHIYPGDQGQLTEPQPTNRFGELLECAATPADTAITTVVTGAEVQLQCLGGGIEGQYVWLFINYTALLDSSFVLRLYDHTGALSGEQPRIFAPVAQRRSIFAWSVGGPALTARADASLPAALDTLGGRLEVVSVRHGIERARWTLDYPGSTTVPRGYSVQLEASSAPQIRYPQVRNRLGEGLSLAGCHASLGEGLTAQLTRWFPGCRDGEAGTEYLVLDRVASPGATLPTVGLLAFDEANRLVADLPSILPARMPANATVNRLLVAGPRFEAVTGVAPDALLPAPLPRGAQAIHLYWIDGTGSRAVIASAFTPTGFPRGLTFDTDPRAFSSTWGIRSTVRRADGTVARLPASCLADSLAAPYRLSQLSLGCLDGNARGQYVQLAEPDSGAWILPGVQLEWFDRAGVRLGAQLLHRDFEGVLLTFPSLRELLAPIGSLAASLGASAIPSGFDSLAGSFRLSLPGEDGEYEYWHEHYSRRVPEPPPLGDAFRPDGDSVWASVQPTPTTEFGQPLTFPGCLTGSPPVDLVVRQVMGACAGGSMSRCFVELMAPTLTFRTPDVGLRVIDADATREVFPLFPEGTLFDGWAQGRRFLVATDSFKVATGVTPDAVMPVPFGLKPVTVEVFQRDLRHGTERVVTSMPLDFVTRPAPATAWQLTGSGVYLSTRNPDPQNWDGFSASLGSDCVASGAGSPTAMQLAGIMLRCRDGATGAQFVQFDRTSALASQPAELQLRLFDHAGHESGRTADLFRAHPGPLWGPVTSFVVGGPGFAAAYGLAPDVPLPAPLDTLGGLVQLVLPGANGEQVLSQLAYGGTDVPLPVPGSGLRFLGGRWQPERRLAPVTSRGTGLPGADCVEGCDAQELTHGLGTPTLSDADRDSVGSLGSSIVFDVPRLTFETRSTGYAARLALRDRFRLEGASADTTVFATLSWNGARRDSCFAGRCVSASRRLLVSVDGATVDTLPASAGATGSLRVAVPLRAGQDVLLRVAAEVTGVSAFNLLQRLTGRLVFDTPRPGLRIRSCRGYDSERDRFVVAASGEPAPREARLEWTTYAGPGFEFEVLRRPLAGDDTLERVVAVVGAEADGRVRYLDPRVAPGEAYSYRLRWPDGDASRVSEAVTVRIPASTGFALLGAWPNPSRGTLRVALSLPEPAEARLEVFDLLGRRVRESRAMLPQGVHQLSADAGRALPAGVYRVRLRADGREAHLNVVVLQ